MVNIYRKYVDIDFEQLNIDFNNLDKLVEIDRIEALDTNKKIYKKNQEIRVKLLEKRRDKYIEATKEAKRLKREERLEKERLERERIDQERFDREREISRLENIQKNE